MNAAAVAALTGLATFGSVMSPAAVLVAGTIAVALTYRAVLQ